MKTGNNIVSLSFLISEKSPNVFMKKAEESPFFIRNRAEKSPNFS
jgi:hypothetical protein